MRQPHLPDAALTPADVPSADAAVDELLAFGHRYHAYKVAGSLPRVSTIAVELHDVWTRDLGARADAVVDAPLPRLRIALFHTARASDHTPDALDDETVSWLRVLVRSVAAAVARSADEGTA